jgi:hypothetical protein
MFGENGNLRMGKGVWPGNMKNLQKSVAIQFPTYIAIARTKFKCYDQS